MRRERDIEGDKEVCNEDDKVVNREIEKDIVQAAIGHASANSLRN